MTAADGGPSGPAVAATKVRPPRPLSGTITRERVVRRVAAGAGGPLTVLSAPAGSGKTTALLQWLDRAGTPVAWVTLDAADDGARRLFGLLLAALDGVVPGAQAAQAAVRDRASLLDAVVPLTVHALEEATGDGVTLVLDGYHHVRDDEAHRALTALLDAAPPTTHVVVSSRTAPPLRLSRRRTAGEATELGLAELAFDPAEAQALLNGRHELALSAAQLALVDEHVAGWPAGLALVAANLSRSADGPSFLAALGRAAQQMDEYLAEEVLERMDPPLAELLVRSAVLDRFTPALCEHVVGTPGARPLLAEARRANLLVAELDGDARGVWYRSPDPFARLLRQALESRSPDLVRELHARASRWFEQAGMAEDAIAHASRAGDGPRAAGLLREAAVELLGSGRHAAVLRLVEEMPAERGPLGPFSEAVHTVALQHRGAGPAVLDERWEQLDAHRDAPGMAWFSLAARVWPFFGRVGETVDLGYRAYRWDRDAISDPSRHAAAARLALALWFAGDVARAHAIAELHVGAVTFPTSRALAHTALALCAADGGAVERALDHAAEATATARRHGGAAALEFSVAFQAEADALRRAGRLDDAAVALTHVERVTGHHPTSLHHAFTLLLRAELGLACDDREDAGRAAATAREVLAPFADVGVLEPRLAAVERALAGHADDGLAGTPPTASELRVLARLADDLSVAQIARDLYLSIHTIKSHRRRLYRRLGVDNRADAVAEARRRGLL